MGFSVGDAVVLHDKNHAVVTSVHKGGKRLGVLFASGKSTFVNVSNAKAAAA